MPPTIAFLHTSPVHESTFEALLAEAAPEATALHHTDESLLTDALASGLGGDLPARVAAAVRDLAGRADVVVCTCSTIGGLATVVPDPAVPVQRVDQAMADAAVAIGRRIAVVAALESTLAPTRTLVAERAAAAGVEVDIVTHIVPGAWDRFAAGNLSGYRAAIAEALPEVAADADVVVLAQASMAGAVASDPGGGATLTRGIPVLSSPRLGVVAALAAALPRVSPRAVIVGAMPNPPTLDLTRDVATLTADLCDIASVSQDEATLADAIESALRALAHLSVTRIQNTIVARTGLGRSERVVIAGHIDTVPLTTDPPNLPTRREPGPDGEILRGRGTVDMKGGCAVMLRLAHEVAEPSRDVTYVFYEAEEIDSRFNGLGLVQAQRPDLLTDADFAVLMEPTGAAVEGGCKGTLRAEITTKGIAAHSARPWKGHNAIHDAAEILARLATYQAQTREVDGLDYPEALNAVLISGGTATNVIPDRCVVTVNYRYAPSVSAQEAEAHVRQVFAGFDLTVVDNAAGARPGLNLPAAQAFVAALGVPVTAKQGWTDVARFSAMGVPAVNFGPGDPNLAHMDDERCPVAQYSVCEEAMRRWLR